MPPSVGFLRQASYHVDYFRWQGAYLSTAVLATCRYFFRHRLGMISMWYFDSSMGINGLDPGVCLNYMCRASCVSQTRPNLQGPSSREIADALRMETQTIDFLYIGRAALRELLDRPFPTNSVLSPLVFPSPWPEGRKAFFDSNAANV